MSLIHYTNCPACGSADISETFSAIDYTISGQSFDVYECGACTLRFTQDVPDATAIGEYYKSENYISHSNTSKGLINRLYKLVRQRAVTQKRKLIEKISGKRNGSLLDVGSGNGTFVYQMKQHGWQVTGLEPDADARKTGKGLYDIDLEDADKFYSLASAPFDVITLWHVLEHVHDLHGYILQLKSLLVAEGKLFIAVPNYTSYDAQHYKQYWAAYDVPRHLYHFSPQAMKKLLEDYQLKIIECRPMWFDSFYVSLLSSKYKSGRTNWFGAIWHGLLSNLKTLHNVKKCSSVIYVIEKSTG